MCSVHLSKINCARDFRQLDNFGREYLRNGSTYQQPKSNFIDCHLFRVGQKIWWTLVNQQKSYKGGCWLTLSRNTMRVLCRSTRMCICVCVLEFGPRDFAAKGISTPKLFPQSDLRRPAASRWALPHIPTSLLFHTPERQLWPFYFALQLHPYSECTQKHCRD